jgi:hypothetical protein
MHVDALGMPVHAQAGNARRAELNAAPDVDANERDQVAMGDDVAMTGRERAMKRREVGRVP